MDMDPPDGPMLDTVARPVLVTRGATLRFVNIAAWRLLGGDERPATLVGKQAAVAQAWAQVITACRGNGPITLKGLDARSRTLRITGAPMGEGDIRWVLLPASGSTRPVGRISPLTHERACLAADEGDVAVFEWNLLTNDVSVSKAHLRLMGLPEDAPWPTRVERLARIHPEDVGAVQRALKDHLSGAAPVYDAIYRFQRFDGPWIWLQTRGRAQRDEGGLPICILGVMTDFTERMAERERLAASEARATHAEHILRDAVDAFPDAFSLFDPNGRLVMGNKQNVHFSSYIPAEALQTGLPIEVMIRQALETGYLGDVLARQEPEAWATQRLDRFRIADGRAWEQRLADGRWLLVSDHRTSTGYTVTIRTDITEIKKREADLARARAEAEEASLAKSNFLALVSHDLRTPLNAIIGFSEIMDSRLFGPLQEGRYSSYPADVLQAGRQLLALVNGILDLSKIESGRVEIAPEPLDLLPLAEECKLMVGPTAAALGVMVEIDPSVAANGQIFADPQMMRQMLINLLANAVKFSGGAGTVTLSCGETVDAWRRIMVTDHGIGMTPDEILVALEPFGRVLLPAGVAREGTGLGLPIVRALVEAHGGSLEISSEPGKGTQVALLFPPPPAGYARPGA